MRNLKKYKKIFKYLIKYIFTVDKNTVKSLQKEDTQKNHIKYRILLFIILIPILYVCIFGYINQGFNYMNIIRTIIALFFIRFITKEMTDAIIVLFFYKSSYRLTLKEIRKFKLIRLKKSKK